MTKRLLLTLIVGLSSLAAGQAAPRTAAAQCRADATAYQNTKVRALRDAGTALTSDLVSPIVAEAKRIARVCADKVVPDGASTTELSALSSLYLYVSDTAKAKSIVALGLTRTGLPEAERAAALIAAEQLAIATVDPFSGIYQEAERYVREIDKMSEAVLALKIEAHGRLLGRYDYADNDDGLRDHAPKLLALSERALKANVLPMNQPGSVSGKPEPEFNSAYISMASAYGALARAAGDFLHADSALKILDLADRAVTSNYVEAHRDFEAQRKMYRLVGTRATPIDGKWWVNAADGTTFRPGDAQVTMIQFTAHWCVPCRNSYPGMLRMTQRFAGKPVESIMVTDLYGFIGDKRNLTPEQEVAEDRDYYAKHHALPYKVAINPELAQGDSVTQDNDRRYAVNGIPEIVIVDRKGIIRATVIGWDQGNEKRLTALIDQILREK